MQRRNGKLFKKIKEGNENNSQLMPRGGAWVKTEKKRGGCSNAQIRRGKGPSSAQRGNRVRSGGKT